MPAKSSTKIFWTVQEKDALCKQAAVLLHEQKTYRKLEALLKAQELVLPPERQRKLLALTGMDWYTSGLSREQELLKAGAVLQAQPATATDTPATPADLALDELWPLLRRRLVSELASFVSDVLAEVRWPTSSSDARAPEVAQATVQSALHRLRQVPAGKVSVLIVGLRGGQMEEIRREFSKTLDVRFFGSDENKEKLRSMCEQADHSVAVTDFISHSHEEILSRRARHYVRSAGGMTRLRELLRSFVTQPEAEAA